MSCHRTLLIAAALYVTASASAQPFDSVAVELDSLAETVLVDSVVAQRVAEGAALDSLLTAHPDVLARHIALAEPPDPWWRRHAIDIVLGAGLFLLAGLGTGAVRQLRRDVDEASRATSPSAAFLEATRSAVQAAERADAAAAVLKRDVKARLDELARTRDTIETQLGQTQNLLDRAERLGLFRASLLKALTDSSDAGATPVAPGHPSPGSET